jgi:hypothetical protein
MGALANKPEIAAGIGHYITSFSDTEMFLSIVFAGMLRDDGRLSYAILKQASNVSGRMRVIADVAEALQAEELAEVKGWIDQAKEAATYRNKLAHNFVGVGDDGRITAGRLFGRNGIAQPEIEITVASLAEKQAKLDALNKEMSDAAKAYLISRRLPAS